MEEPKDKAYSYKHSDGSDGYKGDKENYTKQIDKHLNPELIWAGKKDKDELAVPIVSLHRHEHIDSRAIIERVRKTNSVDYVQESLFKEEQALSKERDVQFYKHDNNWSNRLIAGDSLLVMNSLLEKEGMGGKVQCVYIDPPYGIKYGSNFQPFTNKREVKDKNDADLTSEPEMLKAFRDTWENGIHSYLSYLRDRLLLARELLTDSGSCFVQISDENVHYVRCIMDEVFGRENFVRQISFKTKSPLGSSGLARLTDFLLWYSKDSARVAYNQLFAKKLIGKDSHFTSVELKNGSRRKMNADEIENLKVLPKDSKPFTANSLSSTGYTKSCMYDFEFEGKLFRCGKKSWVTNPEGMRRLIQANRITITGKTPRFVQYYDDLPVQKIHNTWLDTAGEATPTYAVQTSTKVIQRCILMTTDPGDLVFDPTCGSGTTAYVAEQWGRRWITCDTSRVAINLAKQRLMTAVFDYYKLENEHEGVSGGFQYKTVPHITLGSIANNEPPATETLYDQPLTDSKKRRVAAPFTVEAVSSPTVQEISENTKPQGKHYQWLEEIKKTGIRGKKGITTDMKFNRLEVVQSQGYLHAEGETDNPRRVVISFGSEYAPLDKRQVEEALEQAKSLCPDVLVFAAFQFDPEAEEYIKKHQTEKHKTALVQMNIDLQTKDLKKKQSSSESFWLIGQPDVKLARSKGGNFIVSVRGWDYYDAGSGKITSGGQNKIAMWLLDTDYDEKAVFPKQVFFPMAGSKDGWSKLAKSLKTEIDEQLIEQYRSTESLPFAAGEHKKIAVKIIDDRGIESLKVMQLPTRTKAT
ncbi:MAG: site-specific DNA-methyltransferase [Pseudomonadota bacterium]|nr:site-specific DNA-methyltransferase [Pseudomonadota bacterium]